jgi:uncharacterized repeat protein (TIGR03943 family)
MKLSSYRVLQGMILAVLGLFLLTRVWNGTILYYINQRFVLLVVFAGIGLMAVAQIMLQDRARLIQGERVESDGEHEHDHEHDHKHEHGAGRGWNLWWVALPVIIGLLVPAQALGTSVLANRGINTSTPLLSGAAQTSTLELPDVRTNILDWLRAVEAADDPHALVGQPVDVEGFVYHDPRLASEQFMLGRFTITCCVADASAIGMVVIWPEAERLPDNTWMRVSGTLALVEFDGQQAPAIQAEVVEAVAEPQQPYLFP